MHSKSKLADKKSPYINNGWSNRSKFGIVPRRLLTFRIFKNPRWWTAAILWNSYFAIFQQQFVPLLGNTAWWRYCHNEFYYASPYATLSILRNKTAELRKQTCLQLLIVVNDAALKLQISKFKFKTQILITEASFYVYDNVIVSFCALNLWTKFYLLFWSCGFYNEEKLESVLFL